ncbi:MAG: DUF3109 family protein [Bacteroidetes bacterium]|nr:DUF3109 family protein [Bacteroidota bacterium]
MSEQKNIIIRKHRLKHIPELKIDPEITRYRFTRGCSTCNCEGACCAEGVLLDLKEKEKILAHAEIIKKYLEPQQEHDASKWFDQEIEYDIDFPSGKCDGTAVINERCVFLDSKGLCALQKAAAAEGMDKFYLKPFFCVAFPLVIDGHVLAIDETDFIKNPNCWCIAEGGSLTIFDVCHEEFEYILGQEGLEEIEKLFEAVTVAEERTA